MKTILLIIFLVINAINSEQTYYLFNVKITVKYSPVRTDFTISTPFSNGVSVGDSWLGIGFNSINRMVIN